MHQKHKEDNHNNQQWTTWTEMNTTRQKSLWTTPAYQRPWNNGWTVASTRRRTRHNLICFSHNPVFWSGSVWSAEAAACETARNGTKRCPFRVHGACPISFVLEVCLLTFLSPFLASAYVSFCETWGNFQVCTDFSTRVSAKIQQ